MNKSLYFYLIALIFALNLNGADTPYTILNDNELKINSEPRELSEKNRIYIFANMPIYDVSVSRNLEINESTPIELFLQIISLRFKSVEFLYDQKKITENAVLPLSLFYNTNQRRFAKNNELITINQVEFVLTTGVDLNVFFLLMKQQCIKTNGEYKRKCDEESNKCNKKCCSCTIL